MKTKIATIGLLLITNLITTVSSAQVLLDTSKAEKGVQYLEQRKHLLSQDSLKSGIIDDAKAALKECQAASEGFKESASNWQGSAEAWQSAYNASVKRADDNLKAYEAEKKKNKRFWWIGGGMFVLGFIAGAN